MTEYVVLFRPEAEQVVVLQSSSAEAAIESVRRDIDEPGMYVAIPVRMFTPREYRRPEGPPPLEARDVDDVTTVVATSTARVVRDAEPPTATIPAGPVDPDDVG